MSEERDPRLDMPGLWVPAWQLTFPQIALLGPNAPARVDEEGNTYMWLVAHPRSVFLLLHSDRPEDRQMGIRLHGQLSRPAQ